MGPRIYTAQEAVRKIPQLEKIFSELDAIRERLRQVKGKMDVLEMLWGEEVTSESNPDAREYSHYVEQIEDSKKQYEETNKKVAKLEALVKSVDHGLVDFYGVIESRLVFLCWKRGETTIEYYHHLEEGFSGRQPIPSEEPAL